MKQLVAKILVMVIGFSVILGFVLGWFLWDNSPATYISDPNGSKQESQVLNGQGGWYYNSTAGEVRVNLDKPLFHYFRFVSGSYRKQVPSDW
jgi:hypothetical protein